MQKINRPLALATSVLRAQLIGAAKNICPFYRGVNENAFVQILFNQSEASSTDILGYLASPSRVAEGIPQLYSMKRSKQQRHGGSNHVNRGCAGPAILGHERKEKSGISVRRSSHVLSRANPTKAFP